MPFLVLLYCFIVVVIGFYAIEMEKEKMLRLISIFLVLGQFFLSLAITFLSPLTYMLLPWLVINPASNSYFSTAVETKNLLKLLQHFEKRCQITFKTHLGENGNHDHLKQMNLLLSHMLLLKRPD